MHLCVVKIIMIRDKTDKTHERKRKFMKLLIIRHGDPDYSIDSLTEKGWKEAELLSERIASIPLSEGETMTFYQSPLGRARDTASLTLKKLGKTAETMPWLREFDAPVMDEDTGRMRICWDFLPGRWTKEERYYAKDAWFQTPLMAEGDVIRQAAWVWDGLDEILKRHGYERNGNIYRVNRANTDTVVLFCHFGVECVMLAHLLGVSPVVLWHGTIASPSSVTTLITEERRRGIASFRMRSFGDISHLYAGGEEPAFAGRFCETWENREERHD